MKIKTIIKSSLPILAIIIAVCGWKLYPFSQAASKFADECSNNSCCIAYREEMDAIKNKWNENLVAMMDQEKPASAMVDEGFENMRTYQCWMEYICRSVQYSGYGTPESTEGTGIVSAHIGTIPGCQDVEDMGLTSIVDTAKEYMLDNWELMQTVLAGVGSATIDVEMPSDWFASNGLPFIPQCMANPENGNSKISNDSLTKANAFYQNCMDYVATQFGCTGTDDGLQDCSNASEAMIKLETALKTNSADQMARALETKLSTIVPKMQTMEAHMGYLKTKLENLNSRYACYAPKC